MFERIRQTKTVRIRILKGKEEKTITKSFDYDKESKELINKYEQKIKNENKEGIEKKIHVRIVNKETQKAENKTITIRKPETEREEETIKRIKNQLLQLKGVKDPNKNKYYIVVCNLETRKSDTKLVKINTKLNHEEAFEKLKEIVERAVDKKKEEEIVFSGMKNNKKSHEIKLFEKNLKGKSKTFRISLQNHSSKEVYQIILREIGLKKE